jgi:inosine-uridine nucleoside N-ribohydrolase
VDLIIDCDTGSDDAIAILVGALHPALNLLAVTTVEGNCPVAMTTANTLNVLHSAGITGVPVFQGLGAPLLGQPIDRSAGWPQALNLPAAPHTADSAHAVDFLIETLVGANEPVTIAAVGPLSNIAAVFQRAPTVASKIERLAIMGGAIRSGNMTARAEANIFWDPEAAHVVFNSGVNIDLFPLDATHMTTITREDVEAWARSGTAAARTANAFLPERIHMYESKMPLEVAGAPVHDALVVAALVEPELVRFVSAEVQIELCGALTRGETVIDLRGFTEHESRQTNARVAIWADREKFASFLGRLITSA